MTLGPSDREARLRRARRSLDGLSVGDAFGERYFVAPHHAPHLIAERALAPPPWKYTDDTVMALAIVEVLEQHGCIDQDRLAAAFADKYRRDPRRGYGGTAHEILADLGRGLDWRQVAPAVFDGGGSMGNGGAMRAGPVGAYFADDLAEAARQARLSAEVTHAHPEGQAGAIAVAVAAAWAVRGAGEEGDLFATVLAHLPPGETRDGVACASGLARTGTVHKAVATLGNGSRVIAQDTVPFALWCVARHLHHYEEALWTTVAGLGDRDTTCAIVGGIVGLVDGVEIPATWLSARESLATLAA
jgi:ADP-ribosylglycohydrolase